VTTISLNYHISKTAHSSNIWAIPTLCAQEPQKQLLTMLQSVNIDLGFSPRKTLAVYVGYIPLKQDNTSFMSARDLINIGIQEET